MKTIRTTLTLVLSLILIGVFTLQSSTVELEDAVGIWLFDEGTGDIATDSSGLDNHGTLINEPEWVTGWSGSALEFDGGDCYVDCGTDVSLNPSTAITILAWVFVGEYSSGQRSILVRRDYGGANDFQFVNWPADRGGIRFSFWSGGAEKAVDSTDVVPLGDWCHVATTYDGTQGRIYINGVESGVADISGDIDVGESLNTIIGACNQGRSEIFLGLIDEVAIFNIALSEADINEIMTVGLVPALNITAVSPSGKLTTTWGSLKVR
jgi:hypothetical protein